MKSVVSLVERAVIYLANRKRASVRIHLSQKLEQSEIPTIGWKIDAGSGQATQRLTITPEQRSKHIYVLGATGSGKTNLILQLLTSDIAEHRSIGVIDLRGDLIDRVLKRVAVSKPRVDPASVLLLDLRDNARIIGFNPLSGAGDPSSRAYHVLDAIRSNSDSWGIQLEETLRNGLIALAEARLSFIELERHQPADWA